MIIMAYKLIEKSNFSEIKKSNSKNPDKLDFSNLVLSFKSLSDCNHIDSNEEILCYDKIMIKILEEEIKSYMIK